MLFGEISDLACGAVLGMARGATRTRCPAAPVTERRRQVKLSQINDRCPVGWSRVRMAGPQMRFSRASDERQNLFHDVFARTFGPVRFQFPCRFRYINF